MTDNLDNRARLFHLTFADFSLSLEMTTFEDVKAGSRINWKNKVTCLPAKLTKRASFRMERSEMRNL